VTYYINDNENIDCANGDHDQTGTCLLVNSSMP